MDHACIASYVKCTWKSKCLVKSCCFLVNRSNSCSFHMLCNLSFSIHWRCRPRRKFPMENPEVQKKSNTGGLQKKMASPKRFPKSHWSFPRPGLHGPRSQRNGDMSSPESPPNHFPIWRDSSPEKTLSTCTPKKNSWNLFSFSSTSFFVSSFCRLLEGKHRSQHWAGTVPKRKKPECQECVCFARWIGHQSWEF